MFEAWVGLLRALCAVLGGAFARSSTRKSDTLV